MMNPKEKAAELVGKYKSLTWQSGNYKRSLKRGVTHYGVSKSSQRQMTMEAAKQCALIAVEEKRNTLSVCLPYGIEYLNKVSELDEIQTEIENL